MSVAPNQPSGTPQPPEQSSATGTAARTLAALWTNFECFIMPQRSHDAARGLKRCAPIIARASWLCCSTLPSQHSMEVACSRVTCCSHRVQIQSAPLPSPLHGCHACGISIVRVNFKILEKPATLRGSNNMIRTTWSQHHERSKTAPG